MKKALLFFFFALSFFIGKAQWVNIPDTNFGNWLVQNYPSTCVQGNSLIGFQMDTIVIVDSVLPILNLNLSNKNIADFSGLEYLRWDDPNCNYCYQRTLNLSYNRLKRLPNGIGVQDVHLNLSHNEIDTAEFTYAYYDMLDFDISFNHLKYVINDVTGSYSHLTSLNFNNNDLTTLPVFNTIYDAQVYCRKNNFTTLPPLSWKVSSLDCGDNKISNLINLPYKLVGLICDHNLLTSFTFYSNSPFINSLNCSNNNITALYNIPSTLSYLNCSYNQISSIPFLPFSVNTLICNDNPYLSCIPDRLNNLQVFYFNNTQIHCMPNRFACSSFDKNPNTLPLCGPLSGCKYYYNVIGDVHQDTSINCLIDSLKKGNGLSNIKLQLRSNGNIVRQTYSYNKDGDYDIAADSFGHYTVNVDTTFLPFNVICPSPTTRTVNPSVLDTIIENQDFGLECRGTDLAAYCTYGRLRAGRLGEIINIAGDITRIVYNSSCPNNVSGTVITILNGHGHYFSPAPGALTPIATGDTLTFNVADFSVLSNDAFNFIVLVDSAAIIGDLLCISTRVQTASDVNPLNDYNYICLSLLNSFDPNVKEVSPKTISPSGDWLTYTIHFQNTGNDTAYNIFLRDTLSNFLQTETFQYISSSHPATISISQNNALFVFSNINLVDSATNPEGSQGWIQFKVKTKTNLALNTQINNRAAIYFDLNPAIFTNVATTTVQATPCQNSSFTLYDSICQGSVKVFNGINLTTAGNYNDTLVNSSGCDSIITLHLFVKQKSTAQLYDSICQGRVKVFNGSNLTATGNYNDTLINSAGCDSIITLHLFVKQKTTAHLYDSICQGSVKVFNGLNLTTAGNYNDTLVNSAGCDSIITLHLDVKQKSTAYINDTICQGDSKQFNGVNLTQPGDYYDTLIGKNGCDSIIHLHLVTKPTPATPVVNRSNNTLHTSYTANYAYQWIRNNQTIANATDTSYLLTQNGNYTVKVTASNSCSSSSIAFSVVNVGISSIEEEAILLFPNPNTGQFSLSIPESLTGCRLSITDVLGRTVLSTVILQPQESITLTDATSGTYLATCVKDDVKKVLRFVIYK